MITVPHYTWYVVFWTLILGPPAIALTWGVPTIVRRLTEAVALLRKISAAGER